MQSILAIGVQGLRAAETRAQARAVNIVNVHSENYRPLKPVQISTGSGTRVDIRQEPLVTPVDLAHEMVDMRIASHAYRAAAVIVRTGEDMGRTLLDALA